jgi:LEA14-like dessication related protein
MKKLFSLLPLTVLVLLSCAELQQLVQAPTLRIDDVNLNGIDFEKLSLDFVIKVKNPNPFGVNLNGFDYLFTIEGKQLIGGQETRPIALSAQNESSVHFPLTIKFADIYQLVTENKNKDTLSYQFSGSVLPSGILASFRIPFNKSGHLPNVRLPQLSLKNLKVDKLSLTGVDLKLNLNVKNPNSFSFNIGKLDYTLDLAGKQFASGLTQKLADIPAKGNGAVEIPLSLNLAGTLGSIYTALNGQNIQASLRGTADLSTPYGVIPLPINTQTNLKITR